MKTKNIELKRFRKSEWYKNKREEKGDKEKGHIPFIRLFFGIRLAVICFILLFIGVGVASASNDYYVATWGSDSNPGTLNDSWQHPSYAAQQAQAGDTIYLLDGTWYKEYITFANSGTESNPIIMTAYSGTPTLDGVDNDGTAIKIDSEHIYVSGLKIIRYQAGIRVYVSGKYANISNNNINVLEQALSVESDNSTIHHNTLGSSNAGCYRISWASEGGGPHNVLSSNNTIIDSGWNGCVAEGFNITQIGEIVSNAPIHNGLQISTRQGTIEPRSCVFKSCEVYNIGDNGYYLPGRAGDADVLDVIVEDCIAHDTDSRGLVTDELTNITIRRFKSWNIGSRDLHIIDTDDCYIIDSELDMATPNGYQDLTLSNANNVKVINTRFFEQRVSDADLTVYYYLDVLVQDENGNLVEGAKVTLSSFEETPINLHVIPREYTEGFLDPQPITETYTKVDGHTPLPLDSNNTLVIAEYRNDGTITNFDNCIITAEKAGVSATVTGINPDASWYREDPNTYPGEGKGTIIITLPTTLETGTISGIVTNKTSGAPIVGVRVEAGAWFNNTDEYGEYTILNIPEGTYSFTASAEGYENSSELATVTAGNTTTVNFELNPLGDIFPPITNATITPTPNEAGWNNVTPVVVTFFRNDTSGSGISYTNYSKVSETGPWTMVNIGAAMGPDAGNVTDISEDGFNVTIITEGNTTIWYHSEDNNSNIEIAKNVTVKIDTIHPVIYSNVSVSDIIGSSATITWTTDELANSLVKYGTSPGSYTSKKSDVSYVTSHSITVTGLTPNKTYYYVVYSTDQAGNSNQSTEYNFITPEETDLIGSWHLDEKTGEMAVDSSGNGNDGTLVNNPARVKGKIGKALSFDGETDYISIPNSPSLNPANEITIIAWVKPGVIPQSGWNKIIAKPYTSYKSPWQQYALTLHDNQFVFELKTEGTKEGITGTGTLDPNTWYHVAGTYDGSEMRIYINAELNGTQPKSGAIAQYPTNVHIGAGIYSYAQREYINGTIDEVKIYNRALSAVEIIADYEVGSSNSPPVSDPSGPYTGTEGVVIAFDGSGSYDTDGSTVAYEWGFGDGNTATGVTPTHTYAQDGTYTVALTVTDNDSATNTSTTTATIADTEPTADFSASPSSGQEPLTVTFSDNSTSYDGIEAWNWDFNNDSVTDSNVQNPTHVYTEEGVYTVSLTVYESDGDSDTMAKADYITVTKVNKAPYRPANPSPSDGATDVLIEAILSWTGGDPDVDDTVTCDVYFGTSMSPPLVAENQPGTTYDPGTLDHSTEYYWQIVAKDNHDVSNESDIWSFTTAASPGSDLAAEWHLDEGTGEIAVDSSGNGNDGALVNNPTWVKGKIGKALSFDGVNDYISIPNSPSLNPADEITIIAWVKPGVIPQSGWNKIIAKPYTSYRSPWPQYALTLHDNQFVFELKTEGTKDGITGTGTLDPNTWYHVAGTYDGSEMRIYINAKLNGTQPKSGAIAQYPTNVHIGAGIYSYAQREYINGTIDEVKIYNRALSAEEIMADYEAGSSNQPPVSDPSGPYTGTKGVPIAYEGIDSYDTDGSIVAYEWDFGDGGTATGVTPTHTYTQNGTYSVSLTVTDNDGATDTSKTTATIADTGPTAAFSATPTSGQEPLTVAFTDNSASHDGIVAWKWDFNNDSVTDSNVQNPTHVYAEEGVYTVSLRVNESDGDSDTMIKVDYITVTSVNKAPYSPANPSPSDGATDVLIEAVLSWTGGDPDAGDIVTYDVYFGTTTTPPLIAENQKGTAYDTGTLDHSTGYYWQIVAKDNHDVSNESDIWSFTTAASPGSDLAAEWHLDEETGEIAVDSSGNGNDGTLVNNPARVKGKIEKALRFDGVNDYVSIPNSPSLNPADEITIIAWVKPGVIPQSGWNKIIAKPYTSYTSPWQQYALTLHDNQFVFELNTEGTKEGIIGTGTLDPNTWYHVAGTYDGSEMRIYINAELNGTQPKSGAIAQYPTNVHIGAGIYSDAQVEYINGIVDEVKIYNWALGAEEIRADYEAGSSNQPPTAIIDSITPDLAEQGKDTVSFTGHGTDTDGSIIAYSWSSSIDGLLSTASSFSKPASELSVGMHTIYFKVQDNEGAWSTEITEDLTIIEPANQAPASDPSGPYTGTEGVAIAFDGSTSLDPDGSIVAYEWDFGDGTTGTGVAPTHTYAQNGIYTVTLTVTDNDGATNTSTTTATIVDTGHIAAFSATPTSGQKPLTVAFTDNSTSHDGIIAWDWDFDNDGVTDSTEQNPTYVFAEDGLYTVSLKVTESDGDSDTMTKTDYITVTKVNKAPYTPANPSPSDGATDVLIEAVLSWTGGDPDVDDTVTYEVYFGTSMSPPLVAENQPGTTYDPGTLDHSTEYYWQIVAKDNHDVSNESDIWSFTTAASPGSDLAAEWHFDEETGEIAVDSSGNGNDGALVNNPARVKGKIEKALRFDGETDYISIPNSPSLNPADEITIIAWVKPGVIPQSGWNKIIAKPYTSYTSPWQQYALTLHDKQFVFELNTEGTKDGIIGTGTLDPNTWYHVAGTYDGSEMRIYINAELNGTQPKSGAIAQYPTNVHIGAGIYSDAQVEYINGIVDEVKIYNWALGAEEIRADYEAGSSNNPPTAFIDSITPDLAEQGKDTISFTGHGTDTDGSVVAYHWSSSFDGQLSTASSFSKPASELSVGMHTIYFKVQDNEGAWSTEIAEDLIIIEPANQAPASDPSGPYTGTEGVPILFNGSGSYDPDGSIAAYEWTFGDGNTATGATPTHIYAHNGTYTVILTVTDNDGATNTSTTTATIADTEPKADLSATPTSGPEPLTVIFCDHSASYDGIIAWDWDFNNDGATDSTEQNTAYEYTEGGVYTVSLKVSESDGDSDSMTKTDYISVTKVNNPPFKPDNPSPSDGAADVSGDADLSWTGGDPDAEDTVTYDVYFGTSISPPLVVENQPENTYDPGTLDYSTGYYWQIVATDNHGATTEGEVWAFTTAAVPNEAPNTPAEPSPSDSATDVSIDAVVLCWTGGDPDAEDTVTYDVYFGTSISPPLVVENQPENTYDLGTLDYSTGYYWQIVATDNHGATTEGEVWAFTTAAVPNEAPNTPAEPSPSDSATDVSIDAVVLSWTGGDPDAEDTVTYDVYFGTSISPPLVVENQPENTYDPGTLDYSTGYYWQIVATDNHGATTEGEVWAFTTTAAPDTPPIVSNPSATPDTILNDNGRPRIPGTNISQLSVTVTDDTEIDTVTIDLSPIGGSYEAQMTNIPGTDTWTITTNAVEGINVAHDLIVTATDTSGNSDSSVSIQLTILRRGDVDHDNDVDRADLMKIKYSMRNALSVFIADVYPATGDNVVDRKDVFYIFDYVNGKADEP